jgi:MFS family permease
VTLACALVQAAAAPLGGLAGHYYNRATVLSLGCFLWAAMAALFATATSLGAATALWAVNGLGLALLIPNAQSLVADYYRPVSRGKAFGGLFLAGAAGATLGGAFAANLGALRPAGLEGWRAAFLAVAALSAAAGAANLAFSVDPRYRADKREYAQAPDVLKVGPLSARRMAAELGSVLAVPSFAIIILQGVVGNASRRQRRRCRV